MAVSAAAAAEEVKLLGVPLSPFVIRARIALHLKGVRYEFLEEVFGEKSELLLESNPVYAKIPVLIHQGKPICESMIIVQYIDEVWGSAAGPSILPSCPYERATARFWAAYIDDKLFPCAVGILKAQTEAAKAEALEQFAAVLQPLEEEAFEKCSKLGKGFFGGGGGGDDSTTIGYVDLALGCFLRWFSAIEQLCGVAIFVEEKIPSLMGWAERFYSTDAARDVVPETAKFVEFGKLIQALLHAAAAAAAADPSTT